MNWLDWLLDSSGFVTRGQCGHWHPAIRSLYIWSNVLIAVAYFAIPVALVFMHHRHRGDVIARGILLMFAAFIVSCGCTHIADATSFHWAAYRLHAALYAVTAAISVPTAIMLPLAISKALASPTPSEYREILEKAEAESGAKDESIKAQLEMIRGLRHQINNLEQVRQLGVWSDTQQKILEKLYTIVSTGENSVNK